MDLGFNCPAIDLHWIEAYMALVPLRKSAHSAAAIVLSWTIRWTWTLSLSCRDLATLTIKTNCPASSINLSPHKVVNDWSMGRIGPSECVCLCVWLKREFPQVSAHCLLVLGLVSYWSTCQWIQHEKRSWLIFLKCLFCSSFEKKLSKCNSNNKKHSIKLVLAFKKVYQSI